MTDLAKLIVKLEAQTAQYHAELQRSNAKLTAYQKATNARLSAMQKGWASFATTVKRTLGFAAAGLAVRAVVKATEDAQFAFAQLDAAVKSTGGAAGFSTPQLVEMSAALQKQSIFADENVQAMQAVLLQFRRIKGPEFEGAQQAILDLSTRLGKDLQSSAILVGKALNDPIKGMTALGRAGVQFTAEQTATIKALAETGQVAQAQGIILAELSKQFGGAAVAARNTLGGALKALANSFNDLLELSDKTTGGVVDSVNELTTLLQDPATKAAVDALFSVLVAGAREAIAAIVGVTNTLREWFGLVSQAEKSERNIKIAMFISGKSREEVMTELRKQVDARLEFLKTALEAGKIDSGMAAFFRRELANLQAARNEISSGLKMARDAHPVPTRASVLAGEPGSAPVDPDALKSIEDMTEKLREQILTFDKGAAAVIRYRIEQGDLQEVFAKAGPTAGALKSELISLTGQYERMTEAAKKAKEAEAARAQLDEMIASLEEEIAVLGLGEEATAKYRLEHGKLAETLNAAGAAMDGTKEKIIALNAELERKQEAQKAAADAAAKDKAVEEEAAQIYEQTRTAAEKYGAELEHLKELLDAKKIDDETYNRAALQALDRFKEASKEINKFAEEATRNVQDILGSFLEELVTTGKVSFSSLLQDFSTMLIRMDAQAAAANIAGKLFGGAGVGSGGGILGSIGGFVAGMFGGGAVGSAASSGGGSGLGAAFGGARAMGGDVRPGMAYRVGDGGRPEWLIPSTPGRIVTGKGMSEMFARLIEQDQKPGSGGKFSPVMAAAVKDLAGPPAKASGGPSSRPGGRPRSGIAGMMQAVLGKAFVGSQATGGSRKSSGLAGMLHALSIPTAAASQGPTAPHRRSGAAALFESLATHGQAATASTGAARAAAGLFPPAGGARPQPGDRPLNPKQGLLAGAMAKLPGVMASLSKQVRAADAAAAPIGAAGGRKYASGPGNYASEGAGVASARGSPGIPVPPRGLPAGFGSKPPSLASPERLRSQASALIAPLREPSRFMGGLASGPARATMQSLERRHSMRYGGNLAMGGDVRPGMGYRVGDGGRAEWLFPATHGTVVPEKSMSGGMTVHQNFAISAPDSRVSKSTQLQIASAAQRGLEAAARRNN